VEKGDRYNQEIQGTVENIEKKLKEHGLEHRHELGWQSKVGPKRTKWLSPSTPEVIQQSNEKAIFIVPVAFTTDHIETLDEIDIEFREYVEEAGKLFCRAECFNLEKSFIDLCAKLVQEHIAESYMSAIRPCCENCVGKDCAAMREYFSSTPVHYQE
jgi:ferrochelatase